MLSEAEYEDLALTQRFANLEWRLENAAPEIEISSDSPSMQRALGGLERAARTDEPLLLRGEAGTGKTTLAWITHERSARRDGPFVSISCPALQERVASRDGRDSPLRATSLRAAAGLLRGHVAEASGGTLFFDEIEAIPQPLDVTLANLIPSAGSIRAGATETRASNVRVIAATSRDADEPLGNGAASRSLLVRLGATEVRIPPLRERREDILRFALHFVRSLATSMQRPTPRLSHEAKRLLAAHSWPGNIRELRNAIEHALIASSSEVIGIDAFDGRLGRR